MNRPPLSNNEYQAASREDFYTFMNRCFEELNPGNEFLHNWHIEVMATKLQECQRGKCKRLIINVPPRHLKSICASVALPAFWLGHNPTARIMCVSYAQHLADKFSRDTRAIMMSPFYQELFATRLSAERQAVEEFTTTEHGYRLARSVGGSITGHGAGLIIVDDPLIPEEALNPIQRRKVNDHFDSTLYGRLDDKERTGCIIVVMQRLHQDDLVGHLLERGPWEVLSLPAIAPEDRQYVIKTPFGEKTWTRHTGDVLHPERESREELERTRMQLGSYNFAAQYQQAPQPPEGAYVKLEWFRHYDLDQRPARFDEIVQSWDTANKESGFADFSVCTTWGQYDDDIYLLNVYRKQLDYPDLKRAVIEQRDLFHPDTILIEERASGTQLIQEFAREYLRGLEPVAPEHDKLTRLVGQTALIENGRVFLPRDAHWLADYIDELIAFPSCKYDDQVDSTSQALNYMKTNKTTLAIWRKLGREPWRFKI